MQLMFIMLDYILLQEFILRLHTTLSPDMASVHYYHVYCSRRLINYQYSEVHRWMAT